MDDFGPCGCCGGEAEDTDARGIYLTAGYGSNHDTCTFVWAAEPPEGIEGKYFCDPCIDKLLEEGQIEMAWCGLGHDRVGPLSAASLARIFVDGALECYDAMAAQKLSMARRHPDEAGLKAIEHMRGMLATAETRNVNAGSKPPDATLALKIGRAHAIASEALGYAGREEIFREVGSAWAERCIANAAEMRELLDRMMSSLGEPSVN